MDFVENRTFSEISAGDSASLERTLTTEDIALFALVSGDVNPAHLDPDYASHSMFHQVIAHGMWGGALISAVLGTKLPGPGTIYLSQSLRFRRPVHVGDTVTAQVTVTGKQPETHRLDLHCCCLNSSGEEVIVGDAEVIAPLEKIRRPRAKLPHIRLTP